MRWASGITSALLLLLGGACGGDGGDPTVTPTTDLQAVELTVTSSSFAEDGTIPVEHTCEGTDTLPPLSWSDPPPEAVSVAVVVHDPDPRGDPFTHLAVAGLPPELHHLGDGLPPDAIVGTNDFGERGWAGPCPPPADGAHRYRFTVTATSEQLDLDPGFSAEELAAAAEGKVVAQGTLTATYDR